MTGWPSSENPAAPASASSDHLGQLGPGLALRDRAEEPDRDLRLDPRALDERAEDGGRVDDRIGVRHGEDGAVAAGRGRARPRAEILLVLAAGRAQVNVRIDERGREHEPFGLDDAMAVRRQVGAQLGDRAAVDADVDDGVEPLAGIEHAGAAHDQVFLGTVGRDEHHATSWISATLTPTGPCVSRS